MYIKRVFSAQLPVLGGCARVVIAEAGWPSSVKQRCATGADARRVTGRISHKSHLKSQVCAHQLLTRYHIHPSSTAFGIQQLACASLALRSIALFCTIFDSPRTLYRFVQL